MARERGRGLECALKVILLASGWIYGIFEGLTSQSFFFLSDLPSF